LGSSTFGTLFFCLKKWKAQSLLLATSRAALSAILTLLLNSFSSGVGSAGAGVVFAALSALAVGNVAIEGSIS
jgi:hypothetical protein